MPIVNELLGSGDDGTLGQVLDNVGGGGGDDDGGEGTGLGVTGTAGLSEDLIGSDPVGDLTEGMPIVNELLGSGDDGTLGQVLDDVGGGDDDGGEGTGLGVTGTAGLSEDLIGSDPVGDLTEGMPIVNELLGSGDDGTLGQVLDDVGGGGGGDDDGGDGTGLGITDEDGLSEDLIGSDPVGDLLGGGDDGTLGGLADEDGPLAEDDAGSGAGSGGDFDASAGDDQGGNPIGDLVDSLFW
jgi:hypothetical protein